MAITKAARSKIFTLVQEIKKLLVLEVASQLQQFYGIRPDGSILLVEQLPATEPEILHTARLLRQRIDYIKSNIPSEKNKEVESIKQLLNEQAFSILNRFATLRMAEERGIIKETIRKEYNSEGFQIFDSITGQGAVAEQYIRYKWYLHSIFDELSIDLPSIFDRFSPYALIFPNEKAMRSLLTIINNEAVTMHREEGKQPMNLWREDETIGWIYQYYNSREEISEMREASDAPRNSRELAVRNQFFTPRYVVQFLTDNSLGRIWYEMTKGKTELINKCQYLIRRPKELFLDKENTRPENAEEETDYIEHRPIKDPRVILMLDPACGSMHFGLYSFDLFEQIYTEAWDNHPELMLDLRNSITRRQYINQIPEFIIRYNIHGVDIDPRALQIAALSLWLRAQKSFEKLNLEPGERPQITKSNLVLAEAMPGNVELLSALVKPLDAPLRKLVTAIWDLMKMAGETGLLLRIEEEIDRNINEIAGELSHDVKGSQLELDADDRQMKAAERVAFYSTKKYRDSFLENAASEVFRVLKELSETATNGEAYQKLLFADDAARGFAFIELCRKKYDVVLMNPPFGSASINTISYLRSAYPLFSENLYIGFTLRMFELLDAHGLIGSITDRSFINKQSFEGFRKKILFENGLTVLLDLGGEVLDGANVEVSAQLFSGNYKSEALFFDFKKDKEKESAVLKSFKNKNGFEIIQLNTFLNFPYSSFVYNLPKPLLSSFSNGKVIGDTLFTSQRGLASSDANRMFRLFWECPTNSIDLIWSRLQNGSPYCPYYFPTFLVVISEEKSYKTVLSLDSGRITGLEDYFKSGISYGKRTDFIYGYKIRSGSIFSVEGHGVFPINSKNVWFSLLVINSSPYQEVINHLCGQHKTSGYVNPARMTIEKFVDKSDEIMKVVDSLEILDTGNETSPVFIYPHSLKRVEGEFKKIITETVAEKGKVSENVNEFKRQYNQVVENEFEWKGDEKYNKRVDYVKLLFGYENSLRNECLSIISYFVGCLFGHWDIRAINCNRELGSNKFTPLPKFQPGRLIRSNYSPGEQKLIIEDTWLKKRNDILEVPVIGYLKDTNKYVIDDMVSWDGISDESVLGKKIVQVINIFLPKYSVDDILSILGQENILSVLINKNLFFDFHLESYSRFRREAPIYWPISTASGSYTVWLYYPKLSDQTLVAVINNYLQPQIDGVNGQIKPLANNSNLDNNGLKQLNSLREFVHELEEMKKELLRITALPYKPNLDDGVLIAAAPLYNLFRHAKWRKSTENCWKALEKGEYDWAHLAYSIWPDRVIKKCKKDLSMAIAHGLENICEIKPKGKKAKATKAPKKGNVNPQLNFEE